jgi:hypothetical protein
MNCHPRSAQRAVKALCAEFSLPKPKKGVIDAGVLELSQCRDLECPDRTDASKLCKKCPFRQHMANMEKNESKEQYILVGGDAELEEMQARTIRSSRGRKLPHPSSDDSSV